MNNIKTFTTAIIKIALFFLAIYAATAAFAYSTQTVVDPSSITDDYICIKDTMPDAYLCMPKSADPIPWFHKL